MGKEEIYAGSEGGERGEGGEEKDENGCDPQTSLKV